MIESTAGRQCGCAKKPSHGLDFASVFPLELYTQFPSFFIRSLLSVLPSISCTSFHCLFCSFPSGTYIYTSRISGSLLPGKFLQSIFLSFNVHTHRTKSPAWVPAILARDNYHFSHNPVLNNFLALMQPQCIAKVIEHLFIFLDESSVAVLSLCPTPSHLPCSNAAYPCLPSAIENAAVIPSPASARGMSINGCSRWISFGEGIQQCPMEALCYLDSVQNG